jgi:hypothetical protein
MGIGVAELKTLTLNDAASLLDFVIAERNDESRRLSRFLKSKKAAGVQAVVDIAQVGRW